MTPRLRHRPRCPYCGGAFTPTPERDCCVACQRIIHDAEYNPSWDKHYVAKVGWMLAANAGEWVDHMAQRVGGTAHDVEPAVRILRRRGFMIEGRHPTGYRLVGFFGHQTVVTQGTDEGAT